MDDITQPGDRGEALGHDLARLPVTHLTPVGDAPVGDADVLAISCDECSMRCTSACDDCLVMFFVEHDERSLVLDLDQARVVRLLGQAGLVADLKFRDAG